MIVFTKPGRGARSAITILAARIALLAAVAFPAPGAADEYLLQTGDTLRIAIAGFPEFDFTQRIDINGDVTVWLAGSVPVAGLSLPEARNEIAGRLSDELVTRRVFDGTETQTVIVAEEVLVAVTEYRPVYVDGDVSAPGEQTFRAGLTVRQAIALAGGYDIVRARAFDPFLEQADILADENELRREMARLMIAAERNEAARAAETDFEAPPVDFGLPPGEVSDILDQERERLRLGVERLEAERASLALLIEQGGQRIESLRSQLASRIEAEELDQQNVDRVRSSFDRGLIPIASLVDAQRAISDSAARVREVRSDIFGASQQLERVSRELARLDEDRLDALEAERREIGVRMSGVEARLTSALDKLDYVGELRMRRLRLGPDEVAVVLHRTTPNGTTSRAASLDTPLAPGDTIEVVLPDDVLLRPVASGAEPGDG